AHIAYHIVGGSLTKWGEHLLDHLRRQDEWPKAWLVREVFGNPFRPFAPLAPDVLGWNHGIVVNLAAGSYRDRSLPSGPLEPTRLRMLADALEDAGCTDIDAIAHLRGEGPHVRGCWVLDLVLGKDARRLPESLAHPVLGELRWDIEGLVWRSQIRSGP